MKKYTFLFLLFFSFHYCSFGQQENPQYVSTTGSFIQFKNGTKVSVRKPVVVCGNSCYYIGQFNKKCYREDLQNIDGFSRGSNVRWMTNEEFQRIGSTPVMGYFWGIVTLYPTGMGIFILSDLSKRKNIRKLYRSTQKNTYF